MSPEIIVVMRLTGVLAVVGAAIYAVGDVLLLAAKVNLADYLNLQPHAELRSAVFRLMMSALEFPSRAAFRAACRHFKGR